MLLLLLVEILQTEFYLELPLSITRSWVEIEWRDDLL